MVELFPSHTELKRMTPSARAEVASRLRSVILETVSRQGGHLASNLGTVELCVALHTAFAIPDEANVFFDVGHQCYAHKLLTGREESFANLRACAGCSGFPNPEESAADPVVAGHAGVALSQALGDAQGRLFRKKPGLSIAVIGDGALSCGIPWEAMNNLESGGSRLVVILNDNQMSISPNRGALRRCLNRFISGRFYNRVKRALKRGLGASSPGRSQRFWRRIESTIKNAFLPPGTIFQELGMRYFGPFDGNNLEELVELFRRLPENHGQPVLLHLVTRKGAGCDFAERNPSAYHGVGGFQLPGGELKKACGTGFSAVFGQELAALAAKHPEVVALSAAMVDGTGLAEFAKRYPKRIFDTGIAEGHTVAFASGLAQAGMRPVVALYATFFQRALDNLYHDVCLNRLPVIFAIDRAGVVADGPTHHGIYELGFLRTMPNLTVLEPADGRELAAMLRFAFELAAPAVIRYPKADCSQLVDSEVVIELGKARVLQCPEKPAMALWATGAEVRTALAVAKCLADARPQCRAAVVNARFLKPFDGELARKFAGIPQFTIEDNVPAGGLFGALAEALADVPHAPLRAFGWPDGKVIPHGSPAELRERFGLTAEAITQFILKDL
ncbi:MAG: 1-deoxy-D-xylulose-5-phosphate synthase [Victivallales bacterium]|nr:1-deoxy-D-xylulose-5-phosphate synthase [Victivallales bacterium]